MKQSNHIPILYAIIYDAMYNIPFLMQDEAKARFMAKFDPAFVVGMTKYNPRNLFNDRCQILISVKNKYGCLGISP